MAKTRLRNYTRSTWWKHRKARYYRTHERRCYACGAVRYIQLHHLSYARLRREPDSDLVPLCRRCHRAAHRAVSARRCTLAQSAQYVRDRLRRRRAA